MHMTNHRALSVCVHAALVLMFVAGFVGSALPSAQAASSSVVISQVYGGGGNTYTNDFIELFNKGTSSISLNGLSLQYASATGTGNFGATATQSTDLPNVSIDPGQYYLVQEASGTATTALPSPDFTDPTPISLSATGGKIVLVTGTSSLGCNGSSTVCDATATARIIDLVGFGAANFYEGTAPAPAPSNTTADLRAAAGCTDTDDNSADFATAAPAPRNTSTALAPCGTSANQPIATTGPATLTTNVGTATSTPVSATDPDSIVNAASITSGAVAGITLDSFVAAGAAGGTATATLNVASTVADGTYNIVITFTNNDSQSGTLAVTVTVNPPAGVCPTPTASAPLVTIPALQGTTDTNTANGLTRTVRGVVVGDFQGSPGGLNGFYIQDPTGDGDQATSDGVFVFVPAANSAWYTFDVAVGNAVQVTGRATEFQGQTEIDTVTNIAKCGTDTTITPTIVNLPEATNGDLERYEGMLVTIPQTLTVDQNYFQGRYGQVTLSVGGRLYNPTNLYDAGSPDAVALADKNARSLIVLDDANSAQNPNPIPYIGADNTLRPGDTTPGLTGVLDFGAINSDTTIRDYRVQPTAAVAFTRVNARTAAPASVGGNLKVASFNVLNYFSTIAVTGAQCYPSMTVSDCRGANTAAEFTRQRAKIIAAITAIDPDVAGLMEMENNGDTAVQNLVDGLNAATTPNKYAIVPTTAAPGTDAIKVAMIYQPARVTRVGDAVNYQVSDPTYGAALFERPPLTQFFQHIATGERFSVIVNHFKSKSSCPTSATDPDADYNGQGCWNAKRTHQATQLLNFISARQAATGDSDVLVIGDLNSYGMEDPIQVLTAGGLVNEIHKIIGDTAYSFVFDGLSGYLDHALATTSLDPQISGVTEWHINADEPSVIDYNTEFKPPSPDLYTASPYRASDHDPVIVGLNLQAPVTPTPTTTPVTPTPTTTPVTPTPTTPTVKIVQYLPLCQFGQ